MSILIHNWKMEDWEELLKWARIGANNAMLGVNTVAEELPPHGDLIDRDVAYDKIAEQEGGNYVDMDAVDMGLSETPVIIPADNEWPDYRTRVLGIPRDENFCKDCHWYDDEFQYCFRQGNHSYDEASCELWEPKEEKE